MISFIVALLTGWGIFGVITKHLIFQSIFISFLLALPFPLFSNKKNKTS